MNLRIIAIFFCIIIINSQFTNKNLKNNKKPQVKLSGSSISKFNGFNDSFKNQMAVLLGQVTKSNTKETAMFKDKLLIGLISIDNTLTMINKNKNRQGQLKPLLQSQVKTFLNDLDMVQAQLARLNNSSVIGNNNFAAGRVGVVKGNNNTVIGNQNMLLGNNNLLKGNRTIVAGSKNGVKGNNVVTVGVNNKVNGNNAYVFTNNDVINKGNTLTVRDSTIDLGFLNNNNKKAGYVS